MFDKKIAFLIFAAVLITTGIGSGYYFYSKEINSENNKKSEQLRIARNIQNFAAGENWPANYNENAKTEKTTENTKMIYEYYYTQDGITRRKEKNLPPELINKNREIIENVFDEWSIVTFNNDEIILRKEIYDSETTNYILKDYKGLIAVFYDVDDEEKLKELTKTPVDTLPENERQLIKTGISITGNKNLLKILQDYES
ncbi:MAG: hypothetical protein HFE59_01085 [Clostridiales bacterium]|nr:hypothetical protein [Clostridiales bacterium]